jgi:hypothetical protein
MINWNLNSNNIAGLMPSLYKVSEKDLTALFMLYENCVRMGNDSNLNVQIATISTESWFTDLAETIINNVSFVTKTPNFQTLTLNNGDLVSQTWQTEKLDFVSIDLLKDFLEKGSKFEDLVLFSIVGYVDLMSMTKKWTIRFANITDKETKRDNKIDFLVDGTNNN